jgi:fatty acid-binding protein DegV
MLNDMVKACGAIDFTMPYGVIWTGLDEEVANNYATECAALLNGNTAPKYIIGSTIGTHVGPGVFGWAFFQK